MSDKIECDTELLESRFDERILFLGETETLWTE